MASLFWYTGHPDESVQEFVAFTDPVVMESTAIANEAASEDDEDGSGAAEGNACEADELPQYRITGFTFYNREAQVLPFYRDHIESGQEILLSGYVKPVTDGSPQAAGGVPVCDAGPVGSAGGWRASTEEKGRRCTHLIGTNE